MPGPCSCPETQESPESRGPTSAAARRRQPADSGFPVPRSHPAFRLRSAATLTLGAQAGKPQPRLSPTSVSGLARGQSRAPSLSALLYKCASCRAPLGISAHNWPPWPSGWVGRRLTVGPTAPGGPRSPWLPLAPAVPWKPYAGGRLGLVAAPQGWPLPPSAPTLDQDQTPQLVPSLAPAEPHTHPAGPAFLTHPGRPWPTLTTGTGSIGIHPSCPGVTAGRASQGWPLAGGAAWPPRHPVRLNPGDPGRV